MICVNNLPIIITIDSLDDFNFGAYIKSPSAYYNIFLTAAFAEFKSYIVTPVVCTAVQYNNSLNIILIKQYNMAMANI